MKEVVITSPKDCPFRSGRADLDCLCPATKVGACACYEQQERSVAGGSKVVTTFPPGCPLFENDYLIKRRYNGVTKDAE